MQFPCQDLEINEEGRKEALLAAKILKKEINKIKNKKNKFILISSDLKRALNTAEIISKNTKIPLETNPKLKERYFGDSRLSKKLYKHENSYLPIDAESLIDFHKRISEGFESIFKSQKTLDATKIFVSHSKVFKYLSKSLAKKDNAISYGGVAVFIPKSENNWEVKILSESME